MLTNRQTLCAKCDWTPDLPLPSGDLGADRVAGQRKYNVGEELERTIRGHGDRRRQPDIESSEETRKAVRDYYIRSCGDAARPSESPCVLPTQNHNKGTIARHRNSKVPNPPRHQDGSCGGSIFIVHIVIDDCVEESESTRSRHSGCKRQCPLSDNDKLHP